MKCFPFAFLLLLTPVCLHAASFDCSRAHTPIEKAICASPKLSASDDELAQTYRAAQIKIPEAATFVRQSELNWLAAVEQSCHRQEQDISFADCLTGSWQDRIDFLGHIVVRKGGVPFFFREVWVGKPCDEEDMSTGLAKVGSQSDKPDHSDSGDGPCDFYATWPEAISNAPQWRAWNNALLDESRRFQASQDHDDHIPDHWVHFAGAAWDSDDAQVSVELNYVSPTVVVATISRSYTYAHPALHQRGFNWLLKKGCELKRDDLFRPDSDWEAWIKKHVYQTVKNYEINELKDDPTGAEDVAGLAAGVALESRNWEVDPKGLRFIFSEDELPYLDAVTMPDVTLPWSDLKPYLNPSFEIPR